ncbi:MAG: hypothetical protein HOP20_00410 [Sulfuriferula sp.]|nr:hypothetical protein [Sulfuriferula sp.]
MSSVAIAGRRSEYWSLPLATGLWLVLLWVFGHFFVSAHPLTPVPTPPLDARIVELPPPIIKQPPQHVAPLPKTRAVKTTVAQVSPAAPPTPSPIMPVKLVAPVSPAPPQVLATPPLPATPDTASAGTQSMGAHALYQPKPKLPDALRDSAMHAVITAQFNIAADGSVTVTLIQAAADPRVNQSVLNTLKTWRFFPAIQAGKPVATVQVVKVVMDVD